MRCMRNLHGKENALLFTSGYVSNWAALSTLGSRLPNAVILSDALNRPVASDAEPSFSLLATSFMLSEIKHAFQIGFVIFMPFMVIDLVVASILMAVGMMMVPPTVVSLPFKLGFFVLADGWLKITEALLRGYA